MHDSKRQKALEWITDRYQNIEVPEYIYQTIRTALQSPVAPASEAIASQLAADILRETTFGSFQDRVNAAREICYKYLQSPVASASEDVQAFEAMMTATTGATFVDCTPQPPADVQGEIESRAGLDTPQEAFDKIMQSWSMGWPIEHPAIKAWHQTILNALQPPADVSEDERAEACRISFERWVTGQDPFCPSIRKRDGQYILMQTYNSWVAWQAAWSRAKSDERVVSVEDAKHALWMIEDQWDKIMDQKTFNTIKTSLKAAAGEK